MSHSYGGLYDTALKHFERAGRLNPLDNLHHFRRNLLAMSYFGMGSYEKALDAPDNCLAVAPSYPHALQMKRAACCRTAAAAETLALLLARQPTCSITWVSEYLGRGYRLNPDFVAWFRDGGLRAGLPK